MRTYGEWYSTWYNDGVAAEREAWLATADPMEISWHLGHLGDTLDWEEEEALVETELELYRDGVAVADDHPEEIAWRPLEIGSGFAWGVSPE
jgi:hypothetical protein